MRISNKQTSRLLDRIGPHHHEEAMEWFFPKGFLRFHQKLDEISMVLAACNVARTVVMHHHSGTPEAKTGRYRDVLKANAKSHEAKGISQGKALA